MFPVASGDVFVAGFADDVIEGVDCFVEGGVGFGCEIGEVDSVSLVNASQSVLL